MPKTYLVIPDAHATPNHNNSRFDILGRFIIDTRPDVIVNIGDFADMPSLCSYDKGKKSFEGRRYKKDIEVAIDAQRRLFSSVIEYNTQQRRNGKKQYRPELFLTLGNHEQRIDRVIELQAEMEGTISVKDLKYEEFGWQVSPYGTPIFLDGIAFCHNFISGILGRPISGEHPAYSLLTKMHQSCVCGHTHIRDFCERTTADGKHIQGIVVGCYLDSDQWEGYAGEANKLWWKGIVMLHEVADGHFEPQFISIEELKRKYSN